jgi:hypothetical protein
MFNKMLSLAFIGYLGATSTVQAQAECKNDARLYAIGHVINKIKAGETIKPIQMNASTFLNLTQSVRNALGDNITVFNDQCVPVQIYDQKLVTKISVPFEELLLAVEWTFIRNDTDTLTTLLNQFRAAPKTTSELMSLTGPITWSDKTQDSAFKFGWLRAASTIHTRSNSEKMMHIAKCKELRATPTLIELFSKLGGTTSDNTLVSYMPRNHATSYQMLSTDNQYQSTYSGEVQHPKSGKMCSATNVNSVLAALQSTGIRMTKNGNRASGTYRHTYNEMQPWLNTAYPKESKQTVQ